ncbi:hypothetical protein [Marilutibacter alkalisoli]|uniref:Uncharacterized protein n=1 Tax=Marilutibacter alkalisoli TaxID=2591633 RepID=A0A514BUY0_9GAMM|nr:hypothetical protein [Lysobacter alkalisoli]QDH71204.1 hypothetical protein FKV23_14720 [Lysobacter alkalisoli]
MNFDDDLKAAWQNEVRPTPPRQLTDRVRRHRQRHRLQRGLEVVLTCVAVGVFGYALMSRTAGPTHWLLLPFFMVFLPVVWSVVLRAPAPRGGDASEAPQVYARLRLSQLRSGLRDLWLARRAAIALLAYALIALAVSWSFGDAVWRGAATTLLIYASGWLLATFAYSHRLRRRRLREYRSTRRMLGP